MPRWVMAPSRRTRLALVAVVALTCLVGCGGEGDPTPTPTVTTTATVTVSPTPSADVVPSPSASSGGTPRTYAGALARFSASFAADDVPRDLARFVTPSGNIFCVLDAEGLEPACEIAEGGVRDAAACPGNPNGDLVGRIELAGGRPTAICNTDTIRVGEPPVLAYGTVARATAGSVQCLSERSGVTCVDTDARTGFTLARGSYRLLLR